MNVEEFLSTLDALRFDTNLDGTYPELRGMVQKVYPYIRKIYNMMYESGYLTESKQNSKKVTLAESKLNTLISESIKKVMLKEGFFDNPGVSEMMFGMNGFNEKKHKEHKEHEEKHEKKQDNKGDDKQNSKKRQRVIERLKSDKVDVAQYAYALWPDKDEDSARSYFYKCLDGKTNDNGDIYKFSDKEINTLYSLLSNEE